MTRWIGRWTAGCTSALRIGIGYEGLYIVGAISSLGKTTLVTQIGDQIASGGQDVLVFSLEMARAELMAKSISRHTLTLALARKWGTACAKTARGVTDGRRYAQYGEREREVIGAAMLGRNH